MKPDLDADLTLTIEGEGEFIVTIEEPAEFAGVYTVTTDELRGGPVRLRDGVFAYDAAWFTP